MVSRVQTGSNLQIVGDALTAEFDWHKFACCGQKMTLTGREGRHATVQLQRCYYCYHRHRDCADCESVGDGDGADWIVQQ